MFYSNVYYRANVGVFKSNTEIDDKTTAGCTAYFDHTDHEYREKCERDALWIVLDERTNGKFSLHSIDDSVWCKPLKNAPSEDSSCAFLQNKLSQKKQNPVRNPFNHCLMQE